MKPMACLANHTPQLVSEHIDHTTASWREDLVRPVFILVDADAVMRIPLCTRSGADFWAWQGD